MRKATSHGSSAVKDYDELLDDAESIRGNDEICDEVSGFRTDSIKDLHPVSDIRKRHNKRKAKRYLHHLMASPRSRQERSSSKIEDIETKSPPYCSKHDEPIKFMCVSKGCLKDLCSYCILDHQMHINSIKTIENVLEDAARFYQRFDPAGVQESILSNQNANIREIDGLMTDFLNYFNKKVFNLKNNIIMQDKKMLDNVSNKEYFLMKSKEVASRKLLIDSSQLNILQSYLKSEHIQENTIVKIEVEHYLKRFNDVFDDSVKIIKNGVNIETTDCKVPKILHWFEWNKRKLYIYDILKNSTRIIELQINFKIPSYSRSILVPTGQIYLMGGEEPEMVTRDDVYMFDTTLGDGNDMLSIKAKMPFKKYDFTSCVLEGFIYVISGRDINSDVVDKCEKYDYIHDKWHVIAPVKRKRYAASCSSVGGARKIYLFGGRTENNNSMLEDIEEYCSVRDEWNIITLKDPSIWIPVEVAAMIQVEEDKILIFGGSDSRVKDTQNSYVFNVSDYSLEKTEDLKKAQVFVASPVCYGKNVYAIGNEYYVKTRSLNRFNIERREWSIIF